MTIETRHTIELQDIKAIEYECKKCGAKTIRLLNEAHSIAGVCGNCSALWIIDGSPEHGELLRFVNTLRNFPKSNVNNGVRVKLEVVGIVDAEASPSAVARASRATKD